VFGTNVALVLRRLRRLVPILSDGAAPPLLIGCSATLANAAEHFAQVTGSAPEAVKVAALRLSASLCVWLRLSTSLSLSHLFL
jgi:ATP-dependent helicase YprA (DUF1998 family)